MIPFQRELDLVRQEALAAGAFESVICSHHSHGGAGAMDLVMMRITMFFVPICCFPLTYFN
jgi:hypothetical protein